MTTMSYEMLLEKVAIEEVLNRYAIALDSRDWNALDQVFTSDATALYHGPGHFQGREAIVGLVRSVLEKCGATQHLLGNVRISLDGEKAEAKCYLQAIHAGKGAYEGKVMTFWGEYRDKLVKTVDGWRISYRELAALHVEGDIGIT